MKAFVLYAVALLGSHSLYRISELWYGWEWVFGIATVVWFGLFLLGWKRIKPGGAGLIVVTAFVLLDINSIYFVQNLLIAVSSFFIGLMLVPFCRKYQDVVLTSMGFVFINLLINIELDSFATVWMLFIAYGVLVLIGFRFHFLWLKRCFIVLFALTVPLILLNYWFEQAYLIMLLTLAGVAIVAAGSYKFSRQPLL